ncbi:MAG: hypothetical protein AMJ90_07190 [candidate division Zixibacteria bacterium SM23_73_2]|nr:MAG: hypothetical protein AMJ90_07190 [candidate division Zixibacteria bacterium SM23_73_2]
MTDLLKRIKDGEILVADGAAGTLLVEYGLKSGEPPESFNLTRTDVLEKIAGLYLDSGADIIQANTFGASSLRLSMHSLEDKTEMINRNAVRAARKVVKDRAYIYGSCGPTGKILKPYGDTEPDQVYESFLNQLEILVDEGVDVIFVETMTDLTEATLAVKAAKALSSVPVFATMTFDHTPRGFYTFMGVSVESAARGLEGAGVDGLGSNCGNGIENMIKIAEEYKKHTRLPLVIQSNAGIPKIDGDRIVYPETPEFMSEKAKELISLDVSIIGGCCGTTPAHIREIRRVVDSLS